MNLLITGAWPEANTYRSSIKKLGHQIQFLQQEKDELPCAYGWVEGIIANGIFLTHPIEKFANLRYIQLTSVGFDRVPMDYVKEHGIMIHNARGVYSIPMAEVAVGGILDLYKSKKDFAEQQEKHCWEKKRDLKELNGQRVCIIGCGSAGTECAKRMEAFGCLVWGVDTKARDHQHFFCVYQLQDMKEILSKTDIVILALPLTDETYHIFNRKMFEALKPGAIIVNIARGALIDTKAMIEALETKLGGAVLDVFEEEPLCEDSPLWDMDNVIITPHNSFIGSGNNRRLSHVIMSHLEQCRDENIDRISQK